MKTFQEFLTEAKTLSADDIEYMRPSILNKAMKKELNILFKSIYLSGVTESLPNSPKPVSYNNDTKILRIYPKAPTVKWARKYNDGGSRSIEKDYGTTDDNLNKMKKNNANVVSSGIIKFHNDMNWNFYNPYSTKDSHGSYVKNQYFDINLLDLYDEFNIQKPSKL